jgi:acyl carrier protein
MERKFKIRIDQEELVAMTTVGQFLDVVQTKIAGKAQAA